MKVIVNADDFGKNSNINIAIGYCFENDIISSTTLIVNMDGFDEAVQIAKERGFCQNIGLHFNMVEGKALTELIKRCPRICDKDGNFVYKRNSVFFWSREEKHAIQTEFLEQYSKMRVAGLNVTHVDSHQHTHTEIGILNCIKSALQNINIHRVRLSLNYKYSGGVKFLYKSFYNLLLKKYGFRTTDIFCSYYDDFSQRADFLKQDILIEAMLHPEWNDGVLLDAITHQPICKKEIVLSNYSF